MNKFKPGDLCVSQLSYMYDHIDMIAPGEPLRQFKTFDCSKFVTVITTRTTDFKIIGLCFWCFVMTDNMQLGWIPESYLNVIL